MKLILTTPRLYLRQFEPGDEPLLFALNANMEVVQYTGNPPMKDLEEAHQVLIHLIIPQYAKGLGRWAVHIKETHEFIGWCGLKESENGIDLGYRFFKHSWGKGYGGESARAVLDYAFRQLAIEKVVAHAVIQNVHSLKILERIGMKKTESIDQGHRTIQCYALTKAAYLENR